MFSFGMKIVTMKSERKHHQGKKMIEVSRAVKPLYNNFICSDIFLTFKVNDCYTSITLFDV